MAAQCRAVSMHVRIFLCVPSLSYMLDTAGIGNWPPSSSSSPYFLPPPLPPPHPTFSFLLLLLLLLLLFLLLILPSSSSSSFLLLLLAFSWSSSSVPAWSASWTSSPSSASRSRQSGGGERTIWWWVVVDYSQSQFVDMLWFCCLCYTCCIYNLFVLSIQWPIDCDSLVRRWHCSVTIVYVLDTPSVIMATVWATRIIKVTVVSSICRRRGGLATAGWASSSSWRLPSSTLPGWSIGQGRVPGTIPRTISWATSQRATSIWARGVCVCVCGGGGGGGTIQLLFDLFWYMYMYMCVACTCKCRHVNVVHYLSVSVFPCCVCL